MSAAQRRAAEASMARRDRLERGGRRGARAAARSRMPDFLQSDGMEDEELDGGLLSKMKTRTRRQYDERRDRDDLEGVEDVSVLVLGVNLRSNVPFPHRSCQSNNSAISRPSLSPNG